MALPRSVKWASRALVVMSSRPNLYVHCLSVAADTLSCAFCSLSPLGWLLLPLIHSKQLVVAMKRAGMLGEAGDDVGSESDDDDVAAASDVREGATLAEVRHHHVFLGNARTHNSPPLSHLVA